MRETRIVEFKETITNTFLKTVSAFSNYDGGTILFGVDDDGNVKYAVVANSENRMYDYLSKWHDAYICKKIESKLVDTQEERERILEDYARWKSKFPKSIENSKDLKENQKQKLKKKIEELQSEYERLH